MSISLGSGIGIHAAVNADPTTTDNQPTATQNAMPSDRRLCVTTAAVGTASSATCSVLWSSMRDAFVIDASTRSSSIAADPRVEPHVEQVDDKIHHDV